MEKITQEELNEIIAKHQKWLNIKYKNIFEKAKLLEENHEFSEFRCRLYEKDLSNLDFLKFDLREAIFIGCNFTGADLSDVDFSLANLGCSIFNKANMWQANLFYAILTNTSFIDTNFSL